MNSISKFLVLSTIAFSVSFSAVAKKPSAAHKQAKAECLKEDSGLKGKALQSCIKAKKSRMPAKARKK